MTEKEKKERRNAKTITFSVIAIAFIIYMILPIGEQYEYVEYDDDYSEIESFYEIPQQEHHLDYSWIVGTWYVQTPYGTMSIRFEGDGKSGKVIELEDAMNPYSAKYGTYEVRDDEIVYKLPGEPSTYIEIQGKNQLYAGGGYYYKKARG